MAKQSSAKKPKKPKMPKNPIEINLGFPGNVHTWIVEQADGSNFKIGAFDLIVTASGALTFIAQIAGMGNPIVFAVPANGYSFVWLV
jgi:hypothetical protein